MGLSSPSHPFPASHKPDSSDSQFDVLIESGEIYREFGDYELLAEIARGGMGVVYRARQLSLGRTVAVKMVLAGQLATPESIERFRLEAKAAARLHHPGIVRIFEIGEYETQHFYSMELIDGISLADALPDFLISPSADRSNRRSQERAVAELIVQVTRALEFAHEHGVLHRDIKPSNILLDIDGNPHLTDFGLAKLVGDEQSKLTLTNATLGTPGYISPEQAAGGDNITTSTDIYGVGAILYELLTGRPPFAEASAVETMWKAINDLPVPPRQINPALSRDLQTITLRCLEKEPHRRYPSARDLAEELDRFLRHEPILSRPSSVSEHFVRWCRRNPGISSLSAIVLSTILIGSVLTTWQWKRAEVANAQMSVTLHRLEWDSVNDTLRMGQPSRALAKVAAMMRRDNQDWKATSFAMSLMDQHNFPVPAAPSINLDDEFTIARLSPNGTRIATASFDHTARLWDSKTGEQLLPPLQHNGTVNWVEFSPDGQTLVSCSEDKTVRIWEVLTGKEIEVAGQFDEPVLSAQFHSAGGYLLVVTRSRLAVIDINRRESVPLPVLPDGRIIQAKFVGPGLSVFVVLSQTSGHVVLFDCLSGVIHRQLNTGPITRADVDPSLSRIVLVEGSTIQSWDIVAGKMQYERSGGNGPIYDIMFSPDGETFAIRAMNQYVQVWSSQSGIPITKEFHHYYRVADLRFVNQGRHLLSCGYDSLAVIWDIKANERFAEPMQHSLRCVHAEEGMIEGRPVYLATLSHAKARTPGKMIGGVQLWQVHERSSPNRLDQFLSAKDREYDDCSMFSPNGKWVVINGPHRPLHILDRETGEPVCSLEGFEGSVWGMAFSRDHSRLATTTSRGELTIWSIPDGQPLFQGHRIQGAYQPLEVSEDHDIFVTGSTDGYCRIWNFSSATPLQELIHGSEINSVAITSDSQIVASAGEDHVTRLWDTRTGKLKQTLVGHTNEVMRVVFSPDNQFVLTASQDHTARIWSLKTGNELFLLRHQGEVLDAVFSPDGKKIGTGSRDRTAMIWDSHTGKPLLRSLILEQGIRNIRFSPDSKRLLTADFLGIQVWDVESGIPLTVHLPNNFMMGTGFQTSAMAGNFDPSGQTILVAADAAQIALWKVPVPPPHFPDWLPDLMESVAGQRFPATGDTPEFVPTQEFLRLKRQILESHEDGYYTNWAKAWLRADNNHN